MVHVFSSIKSYHNHHLIIIIDAIVILYIVLHQGLYETPFFYSSWSCYETGTFILVISNKFFNSVATFSTVTIILDLCAIHRYFCLSA